MSLKSTQIRFLLSIMATHTHKHIAKRNDYYALLWKSLFFPFFPVSLGLSVWSFPSRPNNKKGTRLPRNIRRTNRFCPFWRVFENRHDSLRFPVMRRQHKTRLRKSRARFQQKTTPLLFTKFGPCWPNFGTATTPRRSHHNQYNPRTHTQPFLHSPHRHALTATSTNLPESAAYTSTVLCCPRQSNPIVVSV